MGISIAPHISLTAMYSSSLNWMLAFLARKSSHTECMPGGSLLTVMRPRRGNCNPFRSGHSCFFSSAQCKAKQELSQRARTLQTFLVEHEPSQRGLYVRTDRQCSVQAAALNFTCQATCLLASFLS